jgi:RNA polymerase sigma-70 factor (ECF subfamily)
MVIMAIPDEEEKAFMQDVYTEYHPMMFSIVKKVSSISMEYEDIVNEVFCVLIKKIPLLRTFPCYKLRAYIVSTCKNVAINYAVRYNRHRARNVFGSEDWMNSFPSEEEGVDEKLESQANYDDLRASLRVMPAKEKQLLMMKYHLGMSDTDIAAILGVKSQSVHVYVDRAKKVAKKTLDEIRQGDDL